MNPTKTIKVLAIIALVFGILGLIGSIFAIIGGGAVTAVSQNEEIMSQIANDEDVSASLSELNNAIGQDVSPEEATAGAGVLFMAAGIIGIISSIFGILEGVFGLKAAKGDVSGASKAFVIGIIEIVIAVIGVFAGAGLVSAVINIAIAALYTYCAKQIKDGAAEVAE